MGITNQMRIIIIITIISLSCKSKSKLSFLAIKDTEVYRFENSTTVNEFILKSGSLKCDGYNIVAKSIEDIEANMNVLIIKATCKFPKQIKLVHQDGIQLPIYKCNGFRKYGINLCGDENSNFELIKEFYLNPQRRPDFPTKPNNATVKFVVDESSTLESIVPMINRIKSIRDEIGKERLAKQPFLLSIQTLKNDSVSIRPPKIVN